MSAQPVMVKAYQRAPVRRAPKAPAKPSVPASIQKLIAAAKNNQIMGALGLSVFTKADLRYLYESGAFGCQGKDGEVYEADHEFGFTNRMLDKMESDFPLSEREQKKLRGVIGTQLVPFLKTL